jgi:hypothetical protein
MITLNLYGDMWILQIMRLFIVQSQVFPVQGHNIP